MSTYAGSGSLSFTGSHVSATSWSKPAFYHEAGGGLSLSAFYVPTQLAGGGVSPSGTALVLASYSYLVGSGMSVGGVGFAKLVTPARTKYRAIPIDPPYMPGGGVPGHCLVYSRDSALAGEHKATTAAWIPKHLLSRHTIVTRQNVRDRKSLAEDEVVSEAC